VLVIGWRPFEVLLRTVAEVAPEFGPGRRPRDVDAYLAFWPQLSTPELELALEIEG